MKRFSILFVLFCGIVGWVIFGLLYIEKDSSSEVEKNINNNDTLILEGDDNIYEKDGTENQGNTDKASEINIENSNNTVEEIVEQNEERNAPTTNVSENPVIIEKIPIENVIEKIDSPKNEVSLLPTIPQHIEAVQNIEEGVLSSEKIIEETNKYRATRGLYGYKNNFLLSRSASQKVDLIFQEQYFQHTAKNGTTMGDLIKGVGYEMITIGENLAYGNYGSEKQIVDSWIDSPGHHALLISPDFLDIGVSVKKGVFNGREVWVAVQHFGRPLSLCSDVSPSGEMRDSIDNTKQRLDELYDIAIQKRNVSISEYNNAVTEYNQLQEMLENYIRIYNQQVQEYNECISQ